MRPPQPGMRACAPPTIVMAQRGGRSRAVALVRLSEPTRDISLETPARPACGSSRCGRCPTVDRGDALPALGRFLDATPDAEIVWLSDGVDLGGGAEFVAAFARLIGKRQITVSGGVPPARALAAADNTAGALTVKVLRAATGTAESGTVRASISRACRSAKFRLPSRPPIWKPMPVQAAGRDPQRHRASRDRRRALGRRRATAR